MTRLLEAHVVAIFVKDQKRSVKRLPVNVPLELVTGQYEELTARELRHLVYDLQHEQVRRGIKEQLPDWGDPGRLEEVAVTTSRPKWDPETSQHKGES